MNDIEILENKLKQLCKSGKRIKIEDMKTIYAICETIQNLIQRNKDLEQIEKEHKEENGRLREENKQLYRQLQDIHENFCKFDWQNSNPKQLHNQLAELYESIYRK